MARVSPIDLFGQQLNFKHTHSSVTDTKSFPVIQFRNISSFPGAFHITKNCLVSLQGGLLGMISTDVSRSTKSWAATAPSIKAPQC